MQNTVDSFSDNKVINIKSETLFREAEDDFYYFYKLKESAAKLQKAIEYTPNHLKSILLLANIYFIQGNFTKAVSLYATANKLKPDDGKILGSIANCYNSLKKYEIAVKYCNSALKNIDFDNYSLFSQVTELKINSLTELKRYNEAYKTFVNSRDILKSTLMKNIYNSLNKKIELYRKLHFSGLRIV